LLWRVHNKQDKILTAIVCTCFILTLADTTYAMVYWKYPYVSNMLKPIVVCAFLCTIRQNLVAVYFDLKDSCAILTIIFSFVFFFAFAGYFFFVSCFEGILFFPDFNEALYNMLILMTTANFPDVMLPAYYHDRFSCLFFIIFLVFGLYFLLNMLLAVVFENYKSRILLRADTKSKKRLKYILTYYERYDE